MKAEFVIFADRIKALRLERGLRQAVLARRMGMTPSQLCKIERGHNGLTGSSIRRLAEAFDMTIAELMGEGNGYFAPKDCSAATEPVADDWVRVVEDDLPRATVEELAKVVAAGKAKVVACRRALGVQVQTSLQLVYPYGVREECAELLARDMRHALGIGCTPISRLENMLEMHGVIIVRHPFASHVKGASFFDRKERTLAIVLNANDTPERNGYRLAYELGCAAAFAMSGFEPIRDEGEVHRFLRRFSSAFLMPEEVVRMDVVQSGIAPERWTFELLVMMKSHFAVSAEAYALRLESLGLIEPGLRAELRDRLREYYRRHPKAMEPQAGDCSFAAILAEAAKGVGR